MQDGRLLVVAHVVVPELLPKDPTRPDTGGRTTCHGKTLELLAGRLLVQFWSLCMMTSSS